MERGTCEVVNIGTVRGVGDEGKRPARCEEAADSTPEHARSTVRNQLGDTKYRRHTSCRLQ